MLSNESSSEEISTESSNAFVQYLKEPAEHKSECRGQAWCTALGQHTLICPVDQVPVIRDTTGDPTMSGCSLVAAQSRKQEQGSPSPTTKVAVTAAVALTQHSYSKDKPLLLDVAKTEEGVTLEEVGRNEMHVAAAAGPCDPKSEAEGTGEANSPSPAIFSASVIFPRSRCGNDGEVASPSLQQGSNNNSQGAEQGSNASHLGSSSSESLQHAQSMPHETQANSDPNTTLSASHTAKAESNLSSLHTTNVKQTGPLDARSSTQDKFFLSHIPQGGEWWRGPASNAGWGIPRGLGLKGGGESSLNNGTAGWGTPPSASSSNNAGGWGQNTSAQNSNPNQGQWGSAPRPGNTNQGPTGQPNPGKGTQSPQQGQQQQTVSASGGQGGSGQQPNSQAPNQQSSQSGNGSTSGQQQPPQNGSPSWAQAAGGAGGGGPGKGPCQPTGPNGGGSSSAKQLEQLNSMREALFSQDGWGGQHVNQDTGWDIPTSPEPGMKDGGSGAGPVWKPNVNNGTDLWEANLRNGGQPPPTTSKTPWGHTPATNIGGTWGEDDDVGDSSNVWHGVPSNNNPPGPQWGGAPAPVPKKESEWGGSNWCDPREMRGNMMEPRSNERDMRGMGMDIRGGGGEMMRPDMMMRGDPRDPRGPGPDPRMGRMNGEAPMWGAPKGQQPPGNQWAGPPPKDMKSSTGWEELSPTAARRQIPNYDDGTSLWGNPGQQQQAGPWRSNKHDGAKVSHWKDIPTPNMGGRGGTGGMQLPPGMGQGRMPGSGGMKPDGSGPMWNHPQRNGSWTEGPGGPHDGPGGWTDEGPGKMSGWNDTTLLGGGQGNWGGPKPKNPMTQGGWGDGSDVDPSSWSHPKPGPKPLTKEIVWASKQFRMLSEMGYKKEDVESALRSCNMNLEDALEFLHSVNPGIRGVGSNNDGWRRHEDHNPFDMSVSSGPHPGGPGGGGYPGRGYNPAQQMPFAPPGPGVNNVPSLMNSANNPSLGSINNMNVVQKISTQQPPPAAQPSAQQSFQLLPRNPQSQPQPSAAQLRMLVQQIQMAVQAGYLNHQILNQPLAPQTLLLLNQLLQQIKILQNALQQQAVAQVQPASKGQSTTVLQISVQITKTKQQITNLQNQIAAQQAIYVKQQQHQQHIAAQGPQTGDFFKPPAIADPISALHGNFGELSMKEPQQTSFQPPQSQSRLTQWKLHSSLDKDGDGSGINEFDRAPGTTTKAQSHTSPNINPLLAQGDSTWSSVGRGGGDSGWPDTATSVDGNNQSDGKEWPNASAQNAAVFTDLVPEFEPGKPWKGTQMKSIEDDPSITPGSVVRSPLSLASIPIKDTEIFSASNKTSPPASVVALSSENVSTPSLNLSSTTWSFNPPASSSSAFASLASNGNNSGRGAGPTGSSSSWGGMPPGGGWSSTWLLLRNLTPQIDGSTLKTLCLQHGPLQSFHLYLSHGLALAKYQSREEAAKAQGALHNCVLGNTTIFAESPAEAEVHNLLQHLHASQPQGPPVASGWGNMRGGGPNTSGGQNAPPQQAPQQSQGPTKPPPDAWGGGSSSGGGSQLWPSPSASSLWGASTLDGGDQHRATPSSLNSFLPGDLLGEGSM